MNDGRGRKSSETEKGLEGDGKKWKVEDCPEVT